MADPSPDTPDFTPPAGAAQDVGWQPTGKIIKEDGGVRLLDSYVLASVYEEVGVFFAPPLLSFCHLPFPISQRPVAAPLTRAA